MNCPFCKINYDPETLVEGRCPNCSGIVSWASDKSDDFDDASFSPMVTVSLGPFPNASVPRPERKPTSINSDAPKPLGSDQPSKPTFDKKESSTSERLGASKIDTADAWAQSNEGGSQQSASGNEADRPDDTLHLNKTITNTSFVSPADTPRGAGASERVLEHRNQEDNNFGGDEPGNGTDGSLGRNRRMLNSGAVKKLNRMWRTATSHASGTLSTIRTDFESDSNSIHVVINERKMNGKNQNALSADYELIEQIGQGAVGVVYAAQQSSIDREVAVKMLHQQADISDEQKEKFLFEAVVTGDLDHPNIVPIHELGKNQTDDLFYSMKKIDGKPWSESVATKALSENLDILMKVCDAVAFAHSRGVVHRDLKPENIMLGEFGEVLVVDWGIALPIAGFSKSELLQSRPSVSGTPAYMAPEMATGPIEKIGIRSDVYLLGAILFEIICKKPPHNGKSTMDCVIAAANNRIIPTDITEEPMSIAMKALETEPADRYSTVTDFQAALREYQSHIESISLSDRAETAFVQATESNDYQDFSRASYAYSEALDLWENNEAARDGIRKTNLAYAKCALKKSDFDLGLSLIDSEEKGFVTVANALRAGIRTRDRRQSLVKTLRNVAFVLVLVLVFGGSWAYWTQVQAGNRIANLLGEEKSARKNAEDAKKAADEATNLAEEERKKAEDSEKSAKKSEENAKNSAKSALSAKVIAESAKQEADDARAEVVKSTYVSQIGAASEKISLNAFSAARKLAFSTKEKSRGLLHWEWGRIDEICNGESQQVAAGQEINNDLIESLTVRLRSANQIELLAVGRATGRVDLIDTKQDRKIRNIDFGKDAVSKKLSSVAFSPDGRQLVVAGEIGGQGIAEIWQVDVDDVTPIRLPPHGTKINAVAFDRDGELLLTASDDKTLKLWQLSEAKLLRTFTGHLGPIWDCDFSPSGRNFVSASQDGTVRIWSIDKEQPQRRFSEHVGPVYCVRHLPDGNRIVSAGDDKRVLRWTILKSSLSEPNTLASESDAPEENIDDSNLVGAIKRRVEGLQNDEKLAKEISPQSAGFRAVGSDSEVLGTHGNAIRVMQLSGNDRTLVSGGDDNLVKLWNLAQKNPEDDKVLQGHGSWIRGAAFSSNNEAVFSGGYDREVRVWDLNSTGNTIEIPSDNQITAAAVSTRGTRLVTTTGDGKAKVLDAKTGEELALLEDGHRFLSTTAILTPDGSTLVTAAGDNTVRVWDFHASIEKTRINKTGRKSVLSLSGNGQRFATGENGEKAIRVFDIGTYNLIKRFAPDIEFNNGSERSIDITTFALSYDGAYLIAGDSYGDCYLWEIAANRLVAKWRGHFSGVVSTYFTNAKVASVEDLTFITAGREGVVAKWKFATASDTEIDSEKQLRIQLSENRSLIREALTKRSRDPLTSMRIDEACENIVITTQNKDEGDDSIDTKLEVIHLVSGEWLNAELFDTKVQSLCFHPNHAGRVLLATSPSRPKETTNGRLNASLTKKTGSILYRWNTQSENAPRPYLAGPDLSRVADMSLLNDGNQMLLVGGNGVRQWNLENGKLDREFRSHGKITCAAFSPSSRLVATGGDEKTVKVWKVESSKAIAKFESEQFEKVSAVHFLDEKNVLIADELGQVFLANVSKTKVLDGKPLIENGSKVNSICVGPNQQLLFLGSDDGSVNVWSLKTYSKLQTLEHSDRVLCVAVSDDGRLLATGTANNLGHIWDTQTWTKKGEATGHAAPVTSVKFSDDRIRLLSASQDGYASVWDLTPTIPALESDLSDLAVTDSVIQLTEVYTLTENSEPLIGAFFVDDGRGVATSCVNGLTTIFRGSEIAPALRLSKGSLDLKPNETKRLDPAILLVCPTIDYSNEFEISVSVKDQETDAAIDFVSLSMSKIPDSKIPDSKVGFKIADGAIMQRRLGAATSNDAGEKVGEITITPQEIRFRFSSFARLETIESVLRTLEIELSQDFDSQQSVGVIYKFKSRRDSQSAESYTVSLRTIGGTERSQLPNQ